MAPRPAPAWPAVTWDTTWYVTNRARRNGELARVHADSLEFGLVVSRFREPRRPGPAGHLDEDVNGEIVDSARLTREEFSARLRALDSAGAAHGTGTIVYVHGYAVSFARAISQGAEIQHRGRHPGPFVVFSWPAHGSVAAWPSPSAPLTRAYRDDSVSAAASVAAFRRAMSDVQRAIRARSLTVVGHSLGAQLAAEAFAAPGPHRAALDANPLAALVLYAPDVGVARLGDTLAPALATVAARRVVYASDGDWLMHLSRLLNGGVPRAGRASVARALASDNFEVIDVTDGRRAAGPFLRWVEPGHAMRYATSALYDFYLVVRGVPAPCRDTLGLATRGADGTWRLSDTRVPPLPGAMTALPAACRPP